MADTQYNDELRGVLFKNDKGDNPSRPDSRGRCIIEGKGYRISAWTKTGKQSAQKFLSLAFTRDETLDPKAETVATPDEGDIPF